MFANDGNYIPLYGGCLLDGVDVFLFIVSLVQTTMEVSLDPSTYIPDAFWWRNDYFTYVRAGGSLVDGSWCGGSCLDLNSSDGFRYWGIGASLSYQIHSGLISVL